MSRQSFMREAQLRGYVRGRQRENEIAAFRTLARADLALEGLVESAAGVAGRADGGGFLWGAFSHGGLMGERTPESVMPLPNLGKRPKA